MVNEAEVEDGDVIDFFFYKDIDTYSDMYAYFADDNGDFLKSLTVTPGETYTLNVKAYAYGKYSLSIPSWRNLFVENVPDGYMIASTPDYSIADYVDGGKLTFTVPEGAASGTLSIEEDPSATLAYRYVLPHLEIIVK